MPFAPSAPTSTSARNCVTTDPRGDSGVVGRHVLDAAPQANLDTGRCGLLREVRVEATSLCHQDQRLAMPPRELARVAQTQPEPVDDVLDDR